MYSFKPVFYFESFGIPKERYGYINNSIEFRWEFREVCFPNKVDGFYLLNDGSWYEPSFYSANKRGDGTYSFRIADNVSNKLSIFYYATKRVFYNSIAPSQAFS